MTNLSKRSTKELKNFIRAIATGILGLALSGTAYGERCFLLSDNPGQWNRSAERLCLANVYILLNPHEPESPDNPRIEKTRITLRGAAPFNQHIFANFLLDDLPSEPGTVSFGVAIPANSIFNNIQIVFRELETFDPERGVQGEVTIGDTRYYYRSM